ncbi:hypothetical protein TrST_g3113 [Triparma strigata]|nr:hypothetical protein TrST_g3113 [Triparma strigata]
MKFYKNGALAGTKTDGWEPNVLTRDYHIIGASDWDGMGYYMDGTIAYMKMWHGVELQQANVTDLFNGRDTTPCPSITSSGGNCATCEAGNYGSSHKSKPTCVLCPAGRFSPTQSAPSVDTCLACGAGKASSSKGAISEDTCTTCDAGKYTSDEGSALCLNCVAGKFSTSVGSNNEEDCSVCAAGTYQNKTGSTSCVVCPAGKYNAHSAISAEDHNSLVDCINCYEGTYLSDEGTNATKHDNSADCQDCSPGKFTNDEKGENECHDCPAGKTSAATASACGVCPSGYKCSDTGTTIPCEKGTYSNNDTLTCSPCPRGHYCPGATDKQLCFVGTYQNATSQKECRACPGGKHQHSRGATVCNDCPPGHFCPERTVTPYECGSEALYCPANSESVTVISQGWYAIEDDGSTENTRKNAAKCEDGYACVGGGRKKCKDDEHTSDDLDSCESCGKFQQYNEITTKCDCKETFIRENDSEEEDGFRCTCPRGKTLVDGKCTACEDGWFKEHNGTGVCTSCDAEVIEDAFKTHPEISKSSNESCACGLGYFRDHHPKRADKRLWKCQDCEDPVIGLNAHNVNCTQIGLTLETLLINDGYWRNSLDSHKIEECDMEEACSQRPGTNGTECREGHDGPICSVCKDGFSKSTLKGICRPCDKLERLLWFYIGGPILLIVTLIGLYYFVRKKYNITGGRRNSINAAIAGFTKASADKNHWLSRIRTRVKILFSFYQIVSSLPETLSIVFPKMYTKFINIVSVISKLNFFEMINLECFLQKTQWLPKSVYGYYGAFLATMLTPILISFALLGFTLYMRRKQNSVEARRKLEATSFFLFFLLLYLVFTNTTQMAFSTLYCGTYSDDKHEYLVVDKSIKCGGSDYIFFKGLAIFFIVLYPIGIPATYLVELYKHRKAIQDAEKRDTNPDIKHISFLWRDYRPKYWWFEVYECGRRLSLTGGLILIGSGSDSVEQLVYALLVSVIGLFVISHCKPYNESEENAIAEYTAWAIFLTFLAAIMITLEYDGTLLSTDDDKEANFAILLIAIEISIFVMVVLGVLHKPLMWLLKKYDTKHIHDAPLKGMGPEVAFSVDLFVEYCKDLARSDAAKAGWLSVENTHGWSKIEQWSEETGAKVEWRCSTGDGPIDQGRVRFKVDQGIDDVRANVLSIKDTHKKGAGSFIYVIDKGEDWRQIYRAVRLAWPWRQRDFVYTEHMRREEGEGDVFVCSRSSSELNETTEEFSVKAGRLRAIIRLGIYRLHALDDGRTEITFIIDADLGGNFAIGFVQRRMLVSYIRGVVEMHRKYAERSKREGGAKSEPPPPLPFISSALLMVAKKGGVGREVATSPLFAGVYAGDSANNGLNIEMGRMVKEVVKKNSSTSDDNGAEGNNDIIVL